MELRELREGITCRRRTFLGLALGSGAIAALPVSRLAGSEQLSRRAQAVLAFFGDRPAIDPSGSLPAYRAPHGHRGGDALAALDETKTRFLDPYGFQRRV